MILEINKLSKVYKNGVKAIDELSLQIGKGMFGLLGPNGAGKSSLMRTIATLQQPDSGTISFDGKNVFDHKMDFRRTLGYLPQSFGVYSKVSAENLLDYFARLKGVSSKSQRAKLIQEVLELTNLYDMRKKHVSSYSGGMKQRFGIAQLLLNKPQLIIVDEPTAGLDPAERVRFLNILREVGTDNTVLFSTHIVEDVKELCHELAIIKAGRIRKETSPSAGINELRGKIWKKRIDRENLQNEEDRYHVLSSGYNLDNSITIRVYADGRPGEDFEPCEPNLEDVYFVALEAGESSNVGFSQMR